MNKSGIKARKSNTTTNLHSKMCGESGKIETRSRSKKIEATSVDNKICEESEKTKSRVKPRKVEVTSPDNKIWETNKRVLRLRRGNKKDENLDLSNALQQANIHQEKETPEKSIETTKSIKALQSESKDCGVSLNLNESSKMGIKSTLIETYVTPKSSSVNELKNIDLYAMNSFTNMKKHADISRLSLRRRSLKFSKSEDDNGENDKKETIDVNKMIDKQTKDLVKFYEKNIENPITSAIENIHENTKTIDGYNSNPKKTDEPTLSANKKIDEPRLNANKTSEDDKKTNTENTEDFQATRKLRKRSLQTAFGDNHKKSEEKVNKPLISMQQNKGKNKIQNKRKPENKPSKFEKDGDDIYAFEASQSSHSSDTEEMSLFKKLAKEGKIQIHKKPVKKDKESKKRIRTEKIWKNIEKNMGINKTLKQQAKNKMNANNIQKISKSGTNDNHSDQENQEDTPFQQTYEADVSILNNKTVIHVKGNNDNEKSSLTSNKINTSVQPFADKSNIQRFSNDKMNISSIYSPISHHRKYDKHELLNFAAQYVKNNSNSSTPLANKITTNNQNDFKTFSPILPKSPNVALENSNTSIIGFDSFFNKSITPAPQNLSTSPEKQIKILNVINLPPITKFKDTSFNQENVTIRRSKANETAVSSESCIVTNQATNRDYDVKNYFGFDEIAEESPISDKSPSNKTIIPEKTKFKRKLRKLRTLLSPKEKKDLNKLNDLKKPKVPKLFNEGEPKQANIRDMLSSTMVENKSKKSLTSDAAGISIDLSAINNDDDSSNSDEEKRNKHNDDDDTISIFDEETNDLLANVDLFNDPVIPNTTLDKTKIHKTYSRTHCKERKKPKNYFIFFSDDGDENDDEKNKHQKRTKGRKKQGHGDKITDNNLKTFFEQTNSILEEAENYELITEIDKST